nr:hypothetical protein [Tanacetum cinerariifolium]
MFVDNMIFLGENVYGSPSEKIKGHGDWNAPEYTDTAGSEINLAFDENLISNEYAVKLCLDYEVKRGNKVVKKELSVALRGELYFVKFIINPKEDDMKPGVILGRSHLTQEKVAKESLALRISKKFALLEEVRPVLETMAYHDKLEGKINENALADTRSDINTMPYWIYDQLGRKEIKKTPKWVCKCGLVDCEVDEEKMSWYSEEELDLLWTVYHKGARKDLYNRMGSMEICQGEIERMSYRQSYHWDRYVGVFEHMVGVYSVPLYRAYNPTGYAQPQYDQYYQQYPPQPPQYQQQPDNDEQVGCVTAYVGSRKQIKKERETKMMQSKDLRN